MKTKRSSAKKKGLIVPDTVQALPIEKQPHTGIVKLSNLRTGRIVRIGAKAAEMLSTKYPDEFRIL